MESESEKKPLFKGVYDSALAKHQHHWQINFPVRTITKALVYDKSFTQISDQCTGVKRFAMMIQLLFPNLKLWNPMSKHWMKYIL